MHLLLALADIAGIVPLPFLSIPISHAIGNSRKCHTGQRVLKASKAVEANPFQS